MIPSTVVKRSHAENVKAYNILGKCSVHVTDWPYDCDAKKQNPTAIVYTCEAHRVWWFEA